MKTKQTKRITTGLLTLAVITLVTVEGGKQILSGFKTYQGQVLQEIAQINNADLYRWGDFGSIRW